MSDSRSENMTHRLLGGTHSYGRVRRWMLLANGGLICRGGWAKLLSSQKCQSAYLLNFNWLALRIFRLGPHLRIAVDFCQLSQPFLRSLMELFLSRRFAFAVAGTLTDQFPVCFGVDRGISWLEVNGRDDVSLG